MNKYDSSIKKVPHFPKEGILFYDITGLLLSPSLFQEAIDELADFLEKREVEVIAGLEARGFLIAAPLAYKMGLPLVLVRKEGKLPRETISQAMELEYGKDVLELHVEDIPRGKKVALVDDILATGGTLLAAKSLLESKGAIVKEAAVLIDLPFLKGSQKIQEKGVEVKKLLSYENDSVL